MSTDKITTRQKIINSAKNLFASHGYSQTTIDDIITAAGVTKGAFYHYFKSKEAVCCEIISSIQREYQSVFDSLLKETDPLKKLKALTKQPLELNNSGQWINSELVLRLSLETELAQTIIKQKLDDFWKWHTEQYRQLITQCRELNLISSNFSIQQQVDFIINILIGNIWSKTAFSKSLDEKMIGYIIEKL